MRADRLVSLVLLLRQRGRLSAATLAEELEVSTRTVLRDIEALSAAGVPVYAERGRHGGFALLPDFRTDLTGLNHDEALALLVAGSRRGVQAFGLGSALASAMLKVVDALPATQRETATAIADRLLIDPQTDLLARRRGGPELSERVIAEVRRAVLVGRRLRIEYAAAAAQDARGRTVDPIGLVSVGDQVYLLATRQGEDRTYRLDRILTAEALTEPAERAESVALERLWAERSRRFRAGGEQLPVRLCLDRAHHDRLLGTALHLAEEPGEPDDPAGWLRLRAVFSDTRHAQWALWEFGTGVRVLSPPWLRESLADRAAALAAHHRPR